MEIAGVAPIFLASANFERARHCRAPHHEGLTARVMPNLILRAAPLLEE
ncbi:MAG: hypothetical protein U1E61_16095 [Bradyrhizobium sp.]